MNSPAMNAAPDKTVVRLKDFRVGNVGKQVSNALGAIADQLTQGMGTWKAKAKTAAHTTDGLVRSKPWHTMGTVALVGLAAGVYMAGRSRRGERTAPSREATHR